MLAQRAPEHLAVIARTTSMYYKGSRKEVAHIRRELAVDYVVEGAPRSVGPALDPAHYVCVDLQRSCDVDATFERMDRAVDESDTMIVGIASSPLLDALHGDPRFVALLRKMNLDPMR